MRKVSFILLVLLALRAATAQAQPLTSTDLPLSATFTTGVTAGHAAGGLFGGEIGWRLNLSWDVFLEGGRMLNTKIAQMDADATTIAQALTIPGRTVTFVAKQPVNYFAAGIRYKFPTTGRVQPYVAVGVGGGKVERHTSFAVNGTDVAVADPPYLVQLAGDLVGNENGALLMLGTGAQIAFGRRLFVDASYRFGRIFLTEAGVNTNRVQFGIGARF